MATKETSRKSVDAPRPRGRPPKAESAIGTKADLTRDAIIDKALLLTKESPLSDVSMVQLAREFDVAPGLIHYYIGNRDNLISGVLNRYYRERVRGLNPPTENWQSDVEEIAKATFALSKRYPGVAQYLASHNRFRLFQQVQPDETDYGVVFFDHVTGAFLKAGFTPEQAALAYHLLMQFLVSSSVAHISQQLPAQHRDFIRKKFDALPDDSYSNAKQVGRPFSQLDSSTAFDAGLSILLSGIANWISTGMEKPKRVKAR